MDKLYETTLLTDYKNNREKSKTVVNKHIDSNKVAVIFDPRYDDLMKAVIYNFMKQLNNWKWNLIIFSSKMYETEIYTDFSNCTFIPIPEQYIYYKDGQPNITIDSYNEIFMSRLLWNKIPYEHILVFQKDCYMYKMFNEEDIFKYDYIGAYCAGLDSVNFAIGCINGGCSYRKKSAMLDCINNVDWHMINVNNHNLISQGINVIEDFIHKQIIYEPVVNNLINLNTLITWKVEDVFFSHACQILKKNLPPTLERDRFSVETPMSYMINGGKIDTCFCHAWNKNYYPFELAKNMLN